MAKEWWWVVVPPAEQNASSVPKDAKIVSTQEGSAAYNTWLNTDSGTVLIGGKPYVRYMGPFATQADAEKAAPGHIGILDLVKGGVATVLNSAIGNPQTGQTAQNEASGNIPNPLSGIAAIGAFFNKLGQAALWLRIAEVALGLALVAVGVAKIVPAFTPAQQIAKRLGA